MSMKSPRRAPAFAIALALTLGVAACSSPAASDDGGPTAGPTGTGPSARTGAAGPSDYPLTVDNCGTQVSVPAPPERILTIKSSTTEMVLALGLGDRLVGTAFSDGPLPDDLAAAGADVPVLAEKAPSSEVVLAAAPDFVYAGWESNFSADAAGERTSLAALDIVTYVSPSACQEPGYQPDPLTFDDVFAEITEAGTLLGAPDAATALVADQREQLTTVAASTSGLSAVWYSSGSDTPFVGGGIGAPQMLMDAVGLENIAADVHETWASLSWEAVGAAEPDVIVLVDSVWNTAEHKIEALESNPTTAALPAVQEGRYLVVAFPATEAGVRNVPAAVDLAGQLTELEATLGR
ncbi:MAG: putative F420-0 ABC transporter substrate-binding protein [Actinomycetales bacterium]|nr:putative F420-0 ABC transporter substrate-binding protein [Actinomycetales bacterium]